jgi:predicted regulator of amino acid metabolism with ACT domain
VGQVVGEAVREAFLEEVNVVDVEDITVVVEHDLPAKLTRLCLSNSRSVKSIVIFFNYYPNNHHWM